MLFYGWNACWGLDTRYSMLDTGYSMLDAGSWMLDAGFWVPVWWSILWQAETPALWMLDILLLVNLWRAGINPAPTINLSELRLLW